MEMKKFLLCTLVFAVVTGTSFAGPAGIDVYIDGLYFNNMAADGYGFDKNAFINLGAEYVKYIKGFRLATSIEDEIHFNGSGDSKLQWAASAMYGWQIAKSTRLMALLTNKLQLNASDSGSYGRYGTVYDEIEPGVRVDQIFDWGSIYLVSEFDIYIPTADGVKVSLLSGVDSGIKLGMTTKLGLWAYARPYFTFVNTRGEAPEEPFEKIEIRVGYTGKRIRPQITVGIPTVTDGVEMAGYNKYYEGRYGGLFIQPKVYFDVTPDFELYVDVWIVNIGGKADGINSIGMATDVGVVPKLGIRYRF
jgi:hypothetical protein